MLLCRKHVNFLTSPEKMFLNVQVTFSVYYLISITFYCILLLTTFGSKIGTLKVTFYEYVANVVDLKLGLFCLPQFNALPVVN